MIAKVYVRYPLAILLMLFLVFMYDNGIIENTVIISIICIVSALLAYEIAALGILLILLYIIFNSFSMPYISVSSAIIIGAIIIAIAISRSKK